MNIEKMREEFDAWNRDVYPGTLLSRKENGDYFNLFVEMAWLGWQASRAALVIELPQEDGMDGHLWAPDVVAAIEAAGVKVKP